jgi:hypothetical protein
MPWRQRCSSPMVYRANGITAAPKSSAALQANMLHIHPK